MTKRSSDRKPVPQVALDKITHYFQRKAVPLYVGFVAIEIGYSLAQTEEMMAVLKDNGVIRPLTGTEKLSRQIRSSDYVWVLAEQPRRAKASS